MGRLELIYTCVSKLVKAIIQKGEQDILPERIISQYGKDSNKNAYCYRLDKEEVLARLEEVTADAILLYELAGELCNIYDEYLILGRLLNDQTRGGKLKPGKEVSPNSLQNPSDEDATFRRKGSKQHQGYVANIVEDCGEHGNIITQYDYKENIHTDTEFGASTIEQLGLQEDETVLITDGAYVSLDNIEAAKGNNIKLVATSLTGTAPNLMINEFTIEDKKVKTCPAGHSPYNSEYKEAKSEYRAYFDKQTCETCPHLANCPVVLQKKRASLKLSQVSIDRANLYAKISTDEYKRYARKRNGVEGIPSILRRRYRIDEMPVRGLVRSKMWFGFKIGAINIKRYVAYASTTTKQYFNHRFVDWILHLISFWRNGYYLALAV
jgi:hypothetical protein